MVLNYQICDFLMLSQLYQNIILTDYFVNWATVVK